MRKALMILVLALSVCGWAERCRGEAEWPQFRGVEASGVAQGEKAPIHFGPSQNLVWKTEVPKGHSSPCIWADRIFLTGVHSGEKLETICLRRSDGKMLWRKSAPAQELEKVSEVASANSNAAAPTPATDGTNVCVYFGSFGLIGYDFDGNEKWRMSLPMPKTDFGTGTSPILFGGRVLLNRDQNGDSFLIALDAGTGQQLWKTERPLSIRGFSTPLIHRNGTVDEVIVAGNVQLAAYDVKDGSLRWIVRGLASFDVCPSPVAGEGLIFAAGVGNEGAGSKLQDYTEVLQKLDQNKDGKLQVAELPKVLKAYGMAFDADKDGVITREEWENVVKFFARGENAVLAVRPDGSGDRTEMDIIWRQRRGVPRVSSPLYYEGRVYVVKDGGLLSCFRAKDGTPLFQLERLKAEGEYYASPIAAGDHIYLCSKQGMVVVIEAGDKLKVIERNKIGEAIYATPAIVEGSLYLRTTEALYAFHEQ